MSRACTVLRAPALLALVLPLTVALGAASSPAPAAADDTAASTSLADPEARAAGTRGAPGIGDPYFPLDGNGGYDVAHYSVRDSYDQARDRLEGTTTIRATATQDLARFDLDLLLDATSVRVDGRPATATSRGGHELVVRPVRAIRAGQAFTVRVAYAGHPAPISYLGERTWLTNGDETVTMNQPHMAPWWFAANDHPLDKATYDVRITARADRQVVSNGRLVRRTARPDGTATTHWRTTEPMATYLAYFALGRYEIRSGTSQGLPFVAAVSKEIAQPQRRTAMAAMLRTPEIVRWLETQVGPYPFSSTGGLTTSLQPGFALENQTRPTYPVLGADREQVMVHELAHQWFGDSVSIAGWRDIWLNEGLATWFEARWTEAQGGESTQAWLERSYAARLDQGAFWSVPVSDPGAARIFDTAVYLRGGMATQALRTRIGQAAFDSLLRTWVSTRRGGNGTSAQFEALAAQVSGTDLTSFFDAWLRSPTPPAHTSANGF